MSKIILFLFIGVTSVSAYHFLKNSSNSTVPTISPCTALCKELASITSKIKKDIESKIPPEEIIEKYKPEVLERANIADYLNKNNPECTEEIETCGIELKDLTADLLKQIKVKNFKKQGVELTTYDAWYTLVKTGVKPGKKYTFKACVTGEFDRMSGPEIIPETKDCIYRKSLNYSRDLTKDKDTNISIVNTKHQILCITAFLTGGEVYLYSINDESDCE